VTSAPIPSPGRINRFRRIFYCVHMNVDEGHPGRAALSRDKQDRGRKPLADAARKSACATI
jgi:hypothetical protein